MSNRAFDIMGQVLDEKFRGTWTCLNYQDLVVFSEKYMELVVQECIGVIEDSEGYSQYFPHVVGNIENHFGVTE